MSVKYGSNRFFPRGDSGGGVIPPGAGLWTLYGGTVVGLTDLTEKVAIGTNAMLADEELRVAGGIAATPTGAGNDAFVQVGSGNSAVVSGANSFRLIYNAGTGQAEISTNGGVYVPLVAGGASPWVAAAGVITEVVPANLVVVGSAAALNADQFQVLGSATFRAAVDSTSAFEFQNAATATIFQVDTSNRAAIVPSGSSLFVGKTSATYSESLGVLSSFAGSGSFKVTEYVKNTTTSNDAAGTTALAVETAQTAGTSAYHEGLNVISRSESTGAITDLIGATINVTTSVAGAAGAITRANGLFIAIGHFGAGTASIVNANAIYISPPTTAAGRTITNNLGINVQNQGATGITTAIGIDVASQSGAATTNLGIRSQSAVVIGTTTVSGLESLRVAAGGAYIDGTQFTATVTGACSINSSGAPINIGNNAVAQAINIGTGAAARTITMGNQTGATSLVLDAGTGNIDIGTSAQGRTVRLATGGAAQLVTLGSTFATSSMTIDTGGALSIATSATNRTISFATAAANQTINFGSLSGTSSLNFSYGSAGWNTTQANVTTGLTPVGFVYTAGTHTTLPSVETTDVNWNLGRTVTFGAGGGTIATQRAFRVQTPTYAAAAPLTITDAATVAIASAPVAGANVSLTRSMAIWVQSGAARFDSGVSVKIVPGGTALQGLGADFRKQNDPANATYNAGTTTVIVGGSYTPATGYLSIVPAWWTLPVATVDPISGGAVLTGIRFTWSDGTTTTRTNASTVAALTETRDAIDFNKDGYTITSIQFIVQNTTANNVTFNFAAWTVDGQQY